MTHHVDLLPGQALFSHPQAGQENLLFSPTKAFMLIMQTDGNLVYYALHDGLLDATWSNIGNPSIYNEVVWNTATSGREIDRCIMLDDGNFVLYDVAGNAAWNSGAAGHIGEGAYFRSRSKTVVQVW